MLFLPVSSNDDAPLAAGAIATTHHGSMFFPPGQVSRL